MEYEELLEAFREVPKPDPVEGGCPCCFTPDEVQGLVDRDPMELTEDDFSGYLGCIPAYAQSDYAYMLPAILRLWKGGLAEYESDHASGMWSDLVRHRVVDEYLSPEHKGAVMRFIRDALLERIGAESSLKVTRMGKEHRWPKMLNNYAAVFTELPELWETIWRAENERHAIAVLHYSSSLAFDVDDNPFFRIQGFSGDLELWGYESELYNEHWLGSNVEFLRETLSWDYLADSTQKIASRFSGGQLERAAAKVMAELISEPRRAKARCEALPGALERETDALPGDWCDLGSF